ncbi:Na+ dependent nucleoside transporter C-terminus-domain-containing protein, partial [Cladochytrium replicatum]
IFIATSLGSPTTEYSTLVQRVQSIAGIIIMLGILFATSRNRKAIQWRVVIVGMFLQYLLALFILRTQLGVNVFQFISNLITTFLGFAYDGLAFIFGNVPKASFAVNVLPAIVFFCAFVSMIYYLGAMQYLVTKVAWVAVRLMDTSGSESVVAVASPFVGQGESALLVRPFVQYMTKSELHSTMTSGFATISGSVLLAYVGYTGNNPSSTAAILTSCVMSVPCSLLVSKLRYPETEESITRGKVRIPPSEEQDANVLHALGNGAATGMNLIILISGALVAIVALYSILNAFTGYLFDMIGIHNEIDGGIWVSLQFILSFVFTPFAFFIGIPPEFCRKAGEFIATKMAANEFVAYSGLRDYAFLPSPQANPDGSLISNGKFDIRTLRLLTFALCGFANFASIGIQIGCLGAIAPNRRKDLATLAFSAMLCGTMSTWITAAVAGALI